MNINIVIVKEKSRNVLLDSERAVLVKLINEHPLNDDEKILQKRIIKFLTT